MYPDGPNPSKVQIVPLHRRAWAPTPLVLIHDGGGTVFSYYLLGDLQRDLWALHNPNYFDGKPWDGGMDAMAKHYIELLNKSGITGNIILGGWSLGGFLSLTIARMLADDPTSKITITGMLIIDSPHHIARSKLDGPMARASIGIIPELVQKSFQNCDIMLQDWDLHSWGAPACGGKEVNVSVGGKKFEVGPAQVLYKPLREPWRTIDIKPFQHQEAPAKAKSPPPAVMIRCVRCTPKAEKTTKPCLIDLHRDKTMLGWEGAHADFIKATIDFDADHFSIFDKFDDQRLENLTKQLKEGLEILDSIAEAGKGGPPPAMSRSMRVDYI